MNCFEIYRNGKLIIRGTEFLNEPSWSNEMMYVPTTRLTLPIYYKEFLNGREEVKIFIDDKCFWGIVKEISLDKSEETVEIDLDHIISEWEYRQISVNRAIKESSLNILYQEEEPEENSDEEDEEEDIEPTVQDTLDHIFHDVNFAYPGWKINFLDDSADITVDYVFSKQNKLEALNKIMELTPDVFWRVKFVDEKVIEIGKFGDIAPFVVSKKLPGQTNISIIEDPELRYDFDEVVNVATVYAEKSDSGMTSLTLREVYDNPKIQLDGFPVVILRENVNNERDYKKYVTQYPKLAPNNELEYAIIDEESIALENGIVIEGSFAFNDLGSFELNGEEITDEDRIEASKTAYHAAVRKLKQSRRSYILTVRTTAIPVAVNVGDRIKFIYDNRLWRMEECSSYFQKILDYDDYYFITKIDYDFNSPNMSTCVLTLEKYLKTDREVLDE